MSTFRYQPGPKGGGGLTTRVVLGPKIEQSTTLTQAASAGGVTTAQAEQVIKSFLQQMLAAAAGSQWSDGLFGLVRFRPSSGGSGMAPDDFNTPDEINADVSLSFLAETIAAWRQTLTLESMGEVGLLTPSIDKVMNLANGHEDEYTVGDMIQLRGSYLRMDRTDPLQGVFLRKADGTEVRCTIYGQNDPGEISALVPTGLTGALGVRVAAPVNGKVRSGTYAMPINPPA